jgi:hypothetical protein
MQWAPIQRKGFGWVRGPVQPALFAGFYPRIDFTPSASTERRITHITAGLEYTLNAAATLQEFQGSARFALWKGQFGDEVELAFFNSANLALPDGITMHAGFIVGVNRTVNLVGTLDAPIMILKPGESGGAIMGGAQSLIAAGFNYIAEFSVNGQEMPVGERPRDYKMR